MKWFPFILLLLLSFTEKSSVADSKHKFTITALFQSDRREAIDTPISVIIGFKDMKYKFKGGKSINDYRKIKLGRVDLSSMGGFSLGNLKYLTLFIYSSSKKDLKIASVDLQENTIRDSNLLNIEYGKYLDQYFSEPDLECRIEYTVRKLYNSPVKYKLDFEFTGEPLNE